ncbi:MAG TPA: TetR family transcriptional regulator [Acidobacteriaceae bacterium]|nr:TetR family transcriptional regulator [Acidobacteriaceae bacterium]
MQKTLDRFGGEQGTKSQDSGSLRERKHEFVLKEIERAAWELFATVGFDRATVEEISRNAGVSRRTFFRYFKTKEELLSFSVEHFGERVAQRFAEMPKNRKPLGALEDAILSVLQEKMHDARQPREMLSLMFEEPNLRGRFLCALSRWVPALSKELARRKAYRGDTARCDLAAALYCTAFDQVHMRWYREGTGDLPTEMKRAFRQLHERNRPGSSR